MAFRLSLALVFWALTPTWSATVKTCSSAFRTVSTGAHDGKVNWSRVSYIDRSLSAKP
jgi:hypothetical protein